MAMADITSKTRLLKYIAENLRSANEDFFSILVQWNILYY